jgi:hypothetical protein
MTTLNRRQLFSAIAGMAAGLLVKPVKQGSFHAYTIPGVKRVPMRSFTLDSVPAMVFPEYVLPRAFIERYAAKLRTINNA